MIGVWKQLTRTHARTEFMLSWIAITSVMTPRAQDKPSSMYVLNTNRNNNIMSSFMTCLNLIHLFTVSGSKHMYSSATNLMIITIVSIIYYFTNKSKHFPWVLQYTQTWYYFYFINYGCPIRIDVYIVSEPSIENLPLFPLVLKDREHVHNIYD